MSLEWVRNYQMKLSHWTFLLGAACFIAPAYADTWTTTTSGRITTSASTTKVGIGLTTVTPRGALDVKGSAIIGSGYAGITSVTPPTNGMLVEGIMAIGASTVPTSGESKLVLGPQTGNSWEGGQLQLNGSGAYKAAFIDNLMFQSNGTPFLRFLSGTNSGSVTTMATFNMITNEFQVYGDVNAKRFVVNGTWSLEVPDYVFKSEFSLPSLEETEKYVRKNHHLPEIPSAKQFKEDGMNLAEMNLRLLKKVEELTLHLIEQNKRIKTLEKGFKR